MYMYASCDAFWPWDCPHATRKNITGLASHTLASSALSGLLLSAIVDMRYLMALLLCTCMYAGTSC